MDPENGVEPTGVEAALLDRTSLELVLLGRGIPWEAVQAMAPAEARDRAAAILALQQEAEWRADLRRWAAQEEAADRMRSAGLRAGPAPARGGGDVGGA